MNYNDVKLVINNGNIESTTIHLPVDKSFKYRLDNSALMVCKDDTPKKGNVAGFYIFRYGDFNSLTTNNVNVNNGTCYDFSIQDLYGYSFKTYLIKYADQTVNRVFLFKIKDDIIGQVEIQKIGAMDWSDYDESDVEAFLYFLVNAQVERNKKNDLNKEKEVKENNYYINSDNVKESSSFDIEEVISSLNKMPFTSKVLVIFMIIFIIAAIVLYLYTKLIIIIFMFIPFILLFASIVIGKYIKSKKNLSRFDLNEVRNDLRYSCKAYNKLKTYFTNLYIITNYYYAYICKYEDIIWMFPMDKYYKGIKVGTDIVIKLYNKKELVIPYNEEFLDIIERRTNNVLLGNSPENQRKYRTIVSDKK